MKFGLDRIFDAALITCRKDSALLAILSARGMQEFMDVRGV
ncbi:hypothetical protein [Celeribacter sp. ULVN23_4]